MTDPAGTDPNSSGGAPTPIDPEGILRKNQELLSEKKQERELRLARERELLQLKYPGISLDGVEDLPFDKADALLQRAKEAYAAPPAAPSQQQPPAVIQDWQTYEASTGAAEGAPKQMTYAEATAAGKTPLEIGRGLADGSII